MGSMRWRSKSSTPRKRTSSVPRSIPFDAKIHTEVIEYLHCLSIECRLILTYIFLADFEGVQEKCPIKRGRKHRIAQNMRTVTNRLETATQVESYNILYDISYVYII